MTPDKVEEIVEEFRRFAGADAVNEEWLRRTLTQYHQDLMDTLIARLKDEKNNIPDKFEQPFELAESVGQKIALDTAVDIIKSLSK